MKASFRKTLFDIHLYAGLFAGAFLLIASLTGCLLAFRNEIQAAVHPEWFHVVPAPGRVSCDGLIASAKAAHPGSALDYVAFDPHSDASVLVRFRDRQEIFVDPHTGAVLGVRDKDRSFLYGVERLHRYLFLGKQGQWITGAASLALLILVGTGIYLWIPKSRKALRAGFSLNRRAKGRAWQVSLHKVVGIYAAVLLVVAAITGAADAVNWVLKTYFQPATTRDAVRSMAVRPTQAAGKPAPAETLWRNALARMPAFQSATIEWPAKGSGPVQVEYVAANAPQPNALSYLFLDPRSGAVLRAAPYEQDGWLERIYLWCLPIHLGQVGGWAGRIIVVGGSLALAFLVVTGGWLYWRRKVQPARRAAAESARLSSSLCASPASSL